MNNMMTNNPTNGTAGATKRLTPEQLKKLRDVLIKMQQEGKDQTEPQKFKALQDYFNNQVNLYRQLQQAQNQQNMQRMAQQGVAPQPSVMQPTYPQQIQQNNQQNQYLFTQQQKEQLKAQIYAFKYHIQKQEDVPVSLLHALQGYNPEVMIREYESVHLGISTPPPVQQPIQVQQPQVIPQPIQQPKIEIPQQQPQPQVMHNMGYVQPQVQPQVQSQPMPQQNQMPNPAARNYNMDAQIKAAPLDLQTLYAERERRLQSLMKLRYQDLKGVVQNKNLTQKERIKAVIEMKQLQVLSFQKKIRNDLIQSMRPTDQNHMNDQRQRYSTRMVEKDARMTDRKVRKTQQEAVSKKTSQHKKFLTELTNTRKAMKDFHKNRLKKSVEKINKDLVAFHERRAKLERERKEKQERARLKALKENDHVAYMKLLEEAKEGRFEELVKKTDEILRRLGAQLVSDRKDTDDKEKINSMDTSVDGASSSIYSKYLESQNTYYSVAHKLVEKVEEQPSMLQGGKLKPYQLQGLQWMVSLYNNKLNGILADEMGLGKTIQTISLITYVMQHKNDLGPHLVIVPLSTIENWSQEFERWAPHIKVVKYTGHKQTRTSLQQQFTRPPYRFNVCLTQYEYISRDKKYLKKVPWNYIIMDEGHRIKNANCKLVTDLFQYTSKHRVLLTGTPLQNDLTELWALLHFLLPKVFDSSVNFEEWFNSPINNATGEKDKVQMTEEETLLIIHRLHQVLRPFLLRREKKDVEDQLPEKVERVIRCDLSAMQKRFYKNISEHNKVLLDTEDGKRKNMSLNNTVMQLRKVCNHPYLFLERHPDLLSTLDPVEIVRTSGKFDLLDRVLPKLRDSNHRVLMFSQMTGVLDIMVDFLEYKGYKFIRLDGNVKAGERGQLVKDFNDKNSDVFVFLLSTRAGGLGLNLQTADTVIIFDSDWNPQQDLQAMARAHRIGQTKKVSVFRLVTFGTVEERIHEVAHNKQTEEARVIKAGLFNQKSTHHDRHEMLQQLLKNKNESIVEDVIPNDDQLNHIIARSEEEIKLFTKMDVERAAAEKQFWAEKGKAVPSRLMVEEELPEWLKDDKIEELEEEDLGRGKRARGQVKYNVDNIPLDSDDEDIFGDGGEEIIDEEEEEDEDEEERPKRGKGKKKITPKKRKVEDVDSEEASPEEDEDEEGGRPKRKRRATMKKMEEKKKPVKKVVEDESDSASTTDDEEITRKYNQIENQLPTMHQKQFFKIWRKLVTLTRNGVYVASLFMKLPEPNSYPDYYHVIKQPIAFDTICNKIMQNQYRIVEELEADVNLLCRNAQQYNLENSPVWLDSVLLQDTFEKEKVQLKSLPPIMTDPFAFVNAMHHAGSIEQPPFFN